MTKVFLPILLCSTWLFAGCTQERPARSVQEFADNPQFLEAAVVRCSANRSETRYDAECLNARQAVSLIEAREERARRVRLEVQSESKRDALRRTHRAATEARRRAAEQDRLSKEAEYLAQFGILPPPEKAASENELEANVPGAIISTTDVAADDAPAVIFDELVRDYDDSIPAADGGNAPGAEIEPASD